MSAPRHPAVVAAGHDFGALAAAAMVPVGVLAVATLAGILEVLGAPAIAVLAAPPFAALAALLAVAFFRRETTAATGSSLTDPRAATALSSHTALAVSADELTAAVVLGGSSVLFAAGFDGLPIVVGGAAGLALAVLFIAPRLRHLDAGSLGAVLVARFPSPSGPSRSVRAIARLADALAMLAALILAAGLLGGATDLLTSLLGVTEPLALALVLCAALVIATAGGIRGTAVVSATAVLLAGAALLVVLGIIGARRSGLPLPHLAYGAALDDIARLEPTLIRGGLTDFRTFRAHATPYLSTSMGNVLALTVVLAAAAASRPMTLLRAAAAADRSAARRGFLGALLVTTLLATLLPAAAAFGKVALEELIAKGAPLTALPSWIFDATRLGLLKVCDAAALDPAALAEACRKLPRHAGRLRLQDVAIADHAHLLLLPAMSGLPVAFSGLLAAGVLALAVAAPAGLLVALALALAAPAPNRPRSLGAERIEILMAALAAAALAWGTGFGWLDGLFWSASLCAGAIFPVLVLALWWRRTTAWGVAAGLVAGAAVTLYYLVGTRYFALAFHETWGHLQPVAPSALRQLASLKRSLQGAEGTAREAILLALDKEAQALTGWWGIRPSAAGIFGLPVALVVAVVVSLITPRAVATGADVEPPVGGPRRDTEAGPA